MRVVCITAHITHHSHITHHPQHTYDYWSGALAAKAEQAKLDEIQNAKREAKKIKSKEKGKVCKVRSWAYWRVTEMILTLR